MLMVVFDQKTKTRVKEFQAYYNLSVDGNIGSETWRALYTLWLEQ